MAQCQPDGRFVVATSVDTHDVLPDARTLKLVLRLDTSNDGTSRYPGLVKYSSVGNLGGRFLVDHKPWGFVFFKAAVVEDSGMDFSKVTPVPPATAVGRTIFEIKYFQLRPSQ